MKKKKKNKSSKLWKNSSSVNKNKRTMAIKNQKSQESHFTVWELNGANDDDFTPPIHALKNDKLCLNMSMCSTKTAQSAIFAGRWLNILLNSFSIHTLI